MCHADDVPSRHGTGPTPRQVVLDLVALVPPGRVTTYGDLAAAASDQLPRRVTARQVGSILAAGTTDEPWWRVVGHDGRLPPGLGEEAARRLAAEGCPLRGRRADVGKARWLP